jgi:hypothetical protein
VTFSYFTPPLTASGGDIIPAVNHATGKTYSLGIIISVDLKSNESFAVGSPIQTNITVSNVNPSVLKSLSLTKVTVFFAGGTNLTLHNFLSYFQGSATVRYRDSGDWTGTVYWEATVNGTKTPIRPTNVDIPELQILPAGAWSRDAVAWIWFGGFVTIAIIIITATVFVYRKPPKRRKAQTHR